MCDVLPDVAHSSDQESGEPIDRGLRVDRLLARRVEHFDALYRIDEFMSQRVEEIALIQSAAKVFPRCR